MIFTLLNRVLTLFLLAGATLVLLFVVFSGSVDSFPFTNFYWLEARTNGISDHDISRWTFWGICVPDSYDSDKNGQCDSLGPDYPLSPYDNFGNSTSLPIDFSDNRDTYFYLSRFAFPMILIALVFSGVSFICAVFQSCWASMKQVMTFFVCLGLLFCAAGVACETAVAVLARNAFKDAGFESKLGATMLGMSWAAVACLIIVFFLCCCSTMHKAYKTHKAHINSNDPNIALETQPPMPPMSQMNQIQEDPLQQQQQRGTFGSEGGIRFFKVKRNNKGNDEESI